MTALLATSVAGPLNVRALLPSKVAGFPVHSAWMICNASSSRRRRSPAPGKS